MLFRSSGGRREAAEDAEGARGRSKTVAVAPGGCCVSYRGTTGKGARTGESEKGGANLSY